MLHGREREQAVLDRLLDAARSGAGGVLVLRGQPGIGKSALLDYAVTAGGGLRVLRATGVESESELAYATLHQLVRPVLDAADRLVPAQADALATALGVREAGRPDRFLVGVATLALLSEAASERPLLCVLDDAQLADRASMEALMFAARRLESDPVAMLVAVRDPDGLSVDAGALREFRLSGLTRQAADALLAESGGEDLAAPVKESLFAGTGGNPLALREIVGVLTGRQRSGHDPLPDPLPLAGGIESLFLDRIRCLRPRAQQLLLLVAAEGAGRLEVIGRAAALLGADLRELTSPELSGLLVMQGQAVSFRHPLVRSAAYQAASPEARRAAHLALAGALGTAAPDRRAWHRGMGAAGPDEEIAAELEQSAILAQRRSGFAAAAAALERAAELTPSEPVRVRRLVAAAEAFWRAGDAGRAGAVLSGAQRLAAGSPAVELDVMALRGSIEQHAGVPADALDILLRAGRSAAGIDPRRSTHILLTAREAAYHAMDMAAVAEIDRLVSELPAEGPSDEALLIRLLGFVSQLIQGRRAGEAGADLSAADRSAAGSIRDPELQMWAGGIVWGLGDYALGLRLRTAAIGRMRATGAAGALAGALDAVVADEILRGHYVLARGYAEEGLRLAREAGRPNTACLHLASLARLAALGGRDQATRALAAEVLAQAAARSLAKAADTAHLALGELALAAGRHEEALTEFGELRGSGLKPGQYGVALNAIPDQIEAAVRAGRPDACRDAAAAYLTWTEGVGAEELKALAARSRALLAAADGAGDDAKAAFGVALRLHAVRTRPFEQARTQLLYGELLRREKRRTDARVQLRAALAGFEGLGAVRWAARAAAELRATGETARPRKPAASEQLTPQELQVARIIGQGASNRDAAAQLFLSPRTVDYHLRKVFTKLGISSRGELIRLVAADDPQLT